MPLPPAPNCLLPMTPPAPPPPRPATTPTHPQRRTRGVIGLFLALPRLPCPSHPSPSSLSALLPPPAEPAAPPSLGPWAMVRTPLCWHVASCFAATTVGGMYLLGTFKSYGLQALGGGSESPYLLLCLLFLK